MEKDKELSEELDKPATIVKQSDDELKEAADVSKLQEIEEIEEVGEIEGKEDKKEKEIEREKINCLKNIKQLTSKWKTVLKKGISYINYELISPECSFEIILEILKNNDIDESLESLKIVLAMEYENYELYKLNIGDIWKLEGKILFSEKLLMGEANLETIIMSSDYYLTNLDFYILAQIYEIPLIFLSTAKFKETNKNYLIMNKNSSKNYYITIVPSVKINQTSQYKLLNKGEELLLNLDMINIPLKTDLVIGNEFDLSSYIKKSKVKKTKKINVLIEKPNKKETPDKDLEEEELLKALETLKVSEVKRANSL